MHSHVGDRLPSHQTMQPLSPPLAQATRRLLHSLLLMPLFLARLVAHGSERESIHTCSAFSVSKLVVFHGKPAPVASTTRYLALAALIVEVYGTHQ